MTKRQLAFAPGAITDARESRLHYEGIDPRLAADFIAKLDLAIELCEHGSKLARNVLLQADAFRLIDDAQLRCSRTQVDATVKPHRAVSLSLCATHERG